VNHGKALRSGRARCRGAGAPSANERATTRATRPTRAWPTNGRRPISFDALARDSATSSGEVLDGASISGASIDQIISAYRRLGAHSRARHQLLRLLAASGELAALAAFADGKPARYLTKPGRRA